MSTEIYYFSGTGNSFYAASRLQKSIPGSKLIPIVSLLNKNKIETKAEVVGIVFPLQGPTFPNAVKQFLEKIDLTKTGYIFAVATRGGTTSRILEEINKILKRQNKSLNSHFHITVFNNDPKLLNKKNNSYEFHIPTKEELAYKEREVIKKINFINKIVINKKTSHEKDKEYDFKYNFILEKIILFAVKLMESKSIKNYFYSDSKCTGCGLCKKVCLAERIEKIDGKPFWNDNKLCYMCYACLNYCPAESVQINSKWYMKSYTAIQGRYSHPYASAKDIESQKSYLNK